MKTKVALPRTRRSRPANVSEPGTSLPNGTRPSLQIRNVLVPIDFSESSLEALKFSAPLLQSFGAELHLIYVEAPDAPLAGLAAMPIALPRTSPVGRLRSGLKHALEKSEIELKQAKIHIVRGQPYEEICRLAGEAQIDLIVIATTGRTGAKHLFLGSTAERVVRYSPCPVLVVRQTKNNRRNGRACTGLNFAKILVPTDFSDCADRGLIMALRLATHFDSTLTLLHSVNPQYYVSSDEYARYDFPQLLQETKRTAQRHLTDSVRHLQDHGFKINGAIAVGHAGQQICDEAKRQQVDLIVTSTHGRTGFKHVLIGSTAEYVVRHAPCPVLVVPSHERPTIKSSRRLDYET